MNRPHCEDKLLQKFTKGEWNLIDVKGEEEDCIIQNNAEVTVQLKFVTKSLDDDYVKMRSTFLDLHLADNET